MTDQEPARPRPTLPGDAELSLGGNCPVQGEGEWNGQELYFRARGSQWSLSVEGEDETDPGLQAWGPMGNAGWIDEADGFERAALHLWAWSAASSAKALGPAGELVLALLAVDPQAARKALSRGADANEPAQMSGPTPLAMALGLFSQESRRERTGGGDDWGRRVEEALAREGVGGEKVDVGAMAKMLRGDMALCDDGRDERRLECVKALLEHGARPDAVAPGWAMAPLDWAALLPSGEPGDDHFGEACGEAGDLARQEAREKRPGRLALNPCFALIEAGADPWARSAWRGESDAPALLESIVDARAMGLADALARTMGEEARWAVAWGWMSRLAREEFGTFASKTSRPAKDAVEEGFGSGEWPAGWIERARERFAGNPAWADATQKALAWAEQAVLQVAVRRAQLARAQRL